MELPELVALYIGAWNEPDAERRQQVLERAWQEDGIYTDPTAHVAGRAALVAHIGGLFKQIPGARFELTSGVDSHHNNIRFAWRLLLPDGSTYVEGIDLGELSTDGKLSRIVGFFGPLPPKA